ncbi:MAG: polysaccharide pyruvyl transferase CsaB [Fimbriimonas ginsengisoli]|uniref:Polysaccharide pyruvyl transferase CsaB n=1 Tax=Fimbriimonas ginsengisoli TaxID=1005039 RepID=A0A931LXC9_FIMGI|nr:polysaccharide pyruvyl transferase CsaB [Fimbriimonas ginsengisoli]
MAAVKLLLAGYFGCGNLGDDAILAGFTRAIDERAYDLMLLSGNPDDTFRNYGVLSVPRRDMTAVTKAIDACDCLVFPGGGIFQDVTSLGSVAYYASLVRKAKKRGKRVLLLGQGVGPLNRMLGKRFAAAAFSSADLVTARDPGSAGLIRSLGVSKRIEVTADTSYLLPPPSDIGEDSGFGVGDRRAVGLAPRPFGRGIDVVGLFGEVAKKLFEANLMPVLVEMDRQADGPLLQEISKKHGGRMPELRKLSTPTQLQQRFRRMEGMIAMRLHAGILAAKVGIAPLMISYDPKVTAFTKLLDLPAALGIEGLNAQRLCDKFMALHKDREQLQKGVLRRVEEMTRLAQRNIELMDETLRPMVRT